ncbi:MAG TPA: SHOCT domain-containing protein [Opitutaceae bacterium]|nr:SHOCT domain-containing protein [Opitutaceae bacterium]
MKFPALGLLLVALLAGCVTADRLNDIRIGMTKDQVISILGKPDSMSAQGNIEYLTYYLVTDTGYGRDAPYSVRIVNGKVESFGRFAQLTDIYMRPVDGSAPQINVGMPFAAVPAAAPHADLATQLERLKALKDQGALTDEEFQKAKEKLLSGSN